MCVCYLDSTNSARVPFLMRRIKRRIPAATPIAVLLGAESASAPATDGYRVVATLDGAVQAIAAAFAAETVPATSHQAEREAEFRGFAGIRAEPVPAG